MPLAQIGTPTNADRDLTSIVTVKTETPHATKATLCQGLIVFGDGSKDLDGTGGDFELTVTVGGQTVQPDPQTITFSTAVRSAVWTTIFPVPANAAVLLRAKSPNGADTDVDVTAYLYEVTGALPDAAPIYCRINLPARIERATAAEEERAVKVEASFIDNAGNPVDPDAVPAFRLYNNILYMDTETYEEVGLVTSTGIKSPASSFPSWHIFVKHSTGLYYFYWNPLPVYTDAEVYMMVGWEWGGAVQYDYASTTLVTDREDLDAIPTVAEMNARTLVAAEYGTLAGQATIAAVTNVIPDSGAMTTIAADTARLTAVRAAVLTDWIDDGRLDLLLDAIPTTKTGYALTAAERNSVADALLARAASNPSAKEYTLNFIICMLMNSNTVDNSGFLTVFDTADSEVAQLPVTVDADADPITGVS